MGRASSIAVTWEAGASVSASWLEPKRVKKETTQSVETRPGTCKISHNCKNPHEFRVNFTSLGAFNGTCAVMEGSLLKCLQTKPEVLHICIQHSRESRRVMRSSPAEAGMGSVRPCLKQ